MQFKSFFLRGLRGTLRLLNGVHFSYAGPWVTVGQNTVLDSWYIGDFSSADYTITLDQGAYSREIIKCLVVAGPESASLTVYGQTYLDSNLVTISATVDNSRVYLTASPVSGVCKAIFSANYYQATNPITTL